MTTILVSGYSLFVSLFELKLIEASRRVHTAPRRLTAMSFSMRQQKLDRLCRGYNKILGPGWPEYWREHVPDGVDAWAYGSVVLRWHMTLQCLLLELIAINIQQLTDIRLRRSRCFQIWTRHKKKLTLNRKAPSRYDTIRDAILTCARKPTWVSIIYRTELTTNDVDAPTTLATL